ncbi:hypothetical protein SteCoe_12144 [Stentor coeruleus]|uniref:Guanylate cyclase domain-containing protein n=1 Tax=Stentor coeruleus TaxID=5963 RepID=A0A1R2CBI3_9CILI|nr:hypothetical protein SteCoe_12144 [Stentor coeruleus]
MKMERIEGEVTAMRYIELQGMGPNTDTLYPDNSIISSRYTKWNFIPKNLLLQFTNPAKIWFLLISILELSILNEEITVAIGTILPLLFLVLIELVREGYNDYLRYKSDYVLNYTEYPVWDGSNFILKFSKDILVGDIILIYNNETPPADIMIIASGNVDHEVYVEASTFLGESSLKIKYAIKEIQLIFDSLDIDEAALRLKCLNEDLHVSLPDADYKSFKGKLKLKISPKSTKVSLDNVIYRGTKITNTPWVFGVALYTGHESKTWINVSKNRPKYSKLIITIERWMMCLYLVIIVVCVLNTLIYSQITHDMPYNWREILVSNIILFAHIIPISLTFSIEVIRISMEAIFRPGTSIIVNRANLFSNLGMVEYIVADKTGTITENNLRIIFCVVVDKVYWNYESIFNSKEQDPENTIKKISTMHYSEKNDDITSLSDLTAIIINNPDEPILLNYLMCMAMCNLAFPEEKDYVALTVDDKELARTAAKLGVKLLCRDPEACMLSILGKEVLFDVLGFQQFSSAKKKSRIVVRNRLTEQIFMYVKGSRESLIELYEDDHTEDEYLDNYRTIYMGYKPMTELEGKTFFLEYLTAKQSPVNKEGRIETVFEKNEKNLIYLGVIGLEDSVSEETQKTVRLLKSAGIKFLLLSGDSEDSTLSAGLAANMYLATDPILSLCHLTSDLNFLNVCQDYIQKGIYETEDDCFSNASIPLQSQEEKAEFLEKGLSFVQRNSLNPSPSGYFQKITTMKNTPDPTNQFIRSKSRLKKTRNATVNPFISKLSFRPQIKTKLHRTYMPDKINYVLSIDSTGLEYGCSSKQFNKYFISLIFAAKFVCFNSLYPDSKRKVVQLLKNNFSFKPVVLSIGDGISDIGMIQEADIGIGINGKEGSDAALSSDISIKHFSQLKKLLLIHGHSQYIQLSKMVLLSFYGMTLLEVILFIYNIFGGFTAVSIIPKELVVIYRLIVSTIPIAGMCILDRDATSTEITPQAFKVGIFNTILTKKNLGIFVVVGIIQGLVIFIFTYLNFESVSPKGYPENMLIIGTSIMFILTSTVLLSSLIETFSISFKTLILYTIVSVILVIICVPISFTPTSLENYLQMMEGYNNVWLCIILTTLINVLVSYVFKSLRYVFYPGIIELVRKTLPEASLNSKTRLENYRKSLKQVFNSSSILNNNIIRDSEKINIKLLRFTSKFRERLYQNDKIAENIKAHKTILVIGGLGTLSYTIYFVSTQYKDLYYIGYLIFYSTVLMLSFLLLKFPKVKDYGDIFYSVMMITTYLFFFLEPLIFYKHNTLDLFCYIPVLYMIGLSNHWLEMCLSISVCNLMIVVSIGFYATGKNSFEQGEIIISYLLIYFSICLLSSIASYGIDHSERLEFNLVQKVQVEIQKTKNVLSYLLPAFVRKRVKNGVRYIAENQGIVSIIFCDIYNFEDLLSNYSPQELITFLDDLFAKFDQKCSLSGCTKIETVGKTYMACAGLKDTENDLDQNFSSVSHARRTVEMGISIISLCENTYLKNGETLKVKIGINTGPVIAGVVGFHKPQFSLVGDTVNTASRMAALCPGPNKIQISKESYDHMRDFSGLNFLQNTVVAKGKGLMNTYLVSISVKDLKVANLISNNTEVNLKRDTKKMTMCNFTSSGKADMKRRSSVLENLNEVIIDEAGEFKRNETQQLSEIKLMSFSCKEDPKEKAFRIESSQMSFTLSKLGLKLRISLDIIFLILAVIGSSIYDQVQYYTLLKLIIELVVLLLLFTRFDKDYCKLKFSWGLGLVYLLGGMLRMIDFQKDKEIIFSDYLLYILQASLCSQLLYSTLSWCITLTAIVQIIITLTKNQMNIQSIIASMIFLVTLLFILYNREKKLRVFSRVKHAAEKELSNTEDLLSKMMPKNVLEKLKDQNHVTEFIPGVSILYADIAGFTQWSSNKLPEEVVEMLSNLFTEFDQKCVEYNVYKVHTIGDCYVALGYTGTKDRSVAVECYNLARFALQLVRTINEVNERHGINLGMRIGIHTGDIIGGIAGTNIVRYDIYGADVLMANKMESTGMLGKVHISETTMSILVKNYKEEFEFYKTDTVEAPISKEDTVTYFLESVKI